MPSIGGITETGGVREAISVMVIFWVFPSGSLKSRLFAFSFVTLPARVVPSLRTMVSMPKPATILADGSTRDSARSSLVRIPPT